MNDTFDLVVYCTDIAYDPPVAGQERDTFCFDDLADIEALKRRVSMWAQFVHIGRRVAVVCASGVNRSGVVCVLVLRHLGYSLDDAMQIVGQSWRGPPAGDVKALLNTYAP